MRRMHVTSALSKRNGAFPHKTWPFLRNSVVSRIFLVAAFVRETTVTRGNESVPMRVTLVQHRVRAVERQTPTRVCSQVDQHAKSRRRVALSLVCHELSQILGHKREAGTRSRESGEITDEHHEVEGGPVRSCPLPRYQSGNPNVHGSIDGPKVKSLILRQHRPSKVLLVHLDRSCQRIIRQLVSTELDSTNTNTP